MQIDWISLGIGGLIGAFFSWIITKIYYEKAKEDSNAQAQNVKKNHEEIIQNFNEIKENSIIIEEIGTKNRL